MDFVKYVTVFMIITVSGILYDRYKKKYLGDDELKNNSLVEKYLLNDMTELGKKPIIWVHTDYEVNARAWSSFGSRNTKKLNKRYIELCVESIIKYCGQSFNVVLINDSSFSNLIPGWTIELNRLADPVKSHIRSLAIAKILYYYGGLLVPNSMLLLKDLKPLYSEMCRYNTMFVGEKVARGSASVHTRFYPSKELMGCVKNSPAMNNYVQRLETLISSDNVSEMDFNGTCDRYLYEMATKGQAQLMCGKQFGVKTKDHKVVLIDDLLGLSHINLCCKKYGIWIPDKELEKRNRYKWFLKLNREQIYESKTNLSKYFAISYGK
jgi:hypothetical protein